MIWCFSVIAESCHWSFTAILHLPSSPFVDFNSFEEDDDDDEEAAIQKEAARMLTLKDLCQVFKLIDEADKIFQSCDAPWIASLWQASAPLIDSPDDSMLASMSQTLCLCI